MPDASALDPTEFAPFFEALWGFSPFPWQTELVEEVAATQKWPGLVDLPTGTGKTSLIDIAIFLMAVDATQPGARWMPRRVVNVVDRRVVVDQAFDRAREIASRLDKPKLEGVLATVADSLRSLAATPRGTEERRDPPLLVAALRGAIVRDESWMRRPDVPAVLSSTIDQAGSRLLFRGYGISRIMRPIHAGLLGNDTLWLLDEVHLARPFARTLRQVGELRAWKADPTHDVPSRWGVVEMSATPTTDEASARPSSWPEPRLCTDPNRRFPERELDAGSHPVIGRRLRASKPAILVEPVKVPADKEKADGLFAAACVKQARGLINDGVGTVGVIVNRVDTARRINVALQETGTETVLMTGRMRPADRDELMRRRRRRLETGRARSTVEAPLALVATQSVEAGADFDLDAIVTEVAPIDSLRQRFGRVDRDGQLSEAGQEASSAILVRSTDLKDRDDPVYGGALAATWDWLMTLSDIDFGIRRLAKPPDRLDPDDSDTSLTREPPASPRLLPTHLDRLVMTSVPVSADPDVSRWLHGDEEASADVQLVWRADIDEELILAAADKNRVRSDLTTRLAVCPPTSSESMSVPLGAVRRWLTAEDPAAVADVEGSGLAVDEPTGRSMRPWVLWTDSRATPQVPRSSPAAERLQRGGASSELRPGVTVVVPAAYGGISDGTWDPTSTERVSDIAMESLLVQRSLAVLRLHPALLPMGLSPTEIPTVGELDAMRITERRERVERLISRLEDLPPEAMEQLREVAAALSGKRFEVVIAEGARWRSASGSVETDSAIISQRVPTPRETSILSGPTADTDATDDAASHTGAGRHSSGAQPGPATLRRHLAGVGAWARYLAEQVGLDPTTAADLEAAGRLHDLGKCDVRFQLWLHGGDEMATEVEPEPLAKSIRPEPSRAVRNAARERSGYPRHARHELTSLPLAEGDIAGCHDAELVAHLVASHHGWCRPFAPPLVDDRPVKVRNDLAENAVAITSDHGMHAIDAGPPDRFVRLNHRYGWFTVPWLESLLRLGDHRRSEIEQLDSGVIPTSPEAAT